MKKSSIRVNQRKREEIIRRFKSAADDRHLLGNHFSELSTVGNQSLCPYLQELKAQYRCETRRDNKPVECDWIDVLCAWFDGGANALERTAVSNRHRSISLSVLSANRSTKNVAVMARLIPLRFKLPVNPRTFETHSTWAMSVGRALSLGSPLDLDTRTQRRLSKFACLLITKGVAKVNQRLKLERTSAGRRTLAGAGDLFYIGPGLHLLKFVGTPDNVVLIRNLPDWSVVARDTGPEVVQAISSRQRARRSNYLTIPLHETAAGRVRMRREKA